MSNSGWVLWVPPVGGASTGMGRYSAQVRTAVQAGVPELEVVRPPAATEGSHRALSAARWLLGRAPVMSGWSRDAHVAGVRAELAARGAPAAVVVDHLMGSWVAREVPPGTPVVYLAHNHESSVQESSFGAGNPLFAAMRSRDAHRRVVDEGRLVRAAALVVAITDDDAARFTADGATTVVVWPPEAPVAPSTDHVAERVARALHLGSFEWRLKAQNLQELLDAYVAAEDAVPLDVVGPGPAEVVPPGQESVCRLGTVDEHEKWELLATRSVGVVYEPRGGGFKLKILDYAAAGLPVVWHRDSAAGFPLHDGVTGLEVDRADEVAGAVARLVGSAELWRACHDGMGRALASYLTDRQARLAAAVAALRAVCGLD